MDMSKKFVSLAVKIDINIFLLEMFQIVFVVTEMGNLKRFYKLGLWLLPQTLQTVEIQQKEQFQRKLTLILKSNILSFRNIKK